jgi:hypothetical protein
MNFSKVIKDISIKFFTYSPILQTIIAGVIWFLINIGYASGIEKLDIVSTKDIFIITFSNLVFCTLCVLPCLSEIIPDSMNNIAIKFIDFDDKPKRFTFNFLMGFLGEQSLGALLVTTLSASLPKMYISYGAIITAIYSWFLYLITIAIMAISLIKFVHNFKEKTKHYILAICFSAILLNSFYNIGILLAPTPEKPSCQKTNVNTKSDSCINELNYNTK